MPSLPDSSPVGIPARMWASLRSQRSSMALAGVLLVLGLATSLGILWLLSELHDELVDPWARQFDIPSPLTSGEGVQ